MIRGTRMLAAVACHAGVVLGGAAFGSQPQSNLPGPDDGTVRDRAQRQAAEPARIGAGLAEPGGQTAGEGTEQAGGPPDPALMQAEMARALRPRWSAETTFDATLPGELGVGGDLAVYTTGVRLGVTLPRADRSALVFGINARRTEYNWSDGDALGLGGEQPVQRVNEWRLNARYLKPVNERWSWFAGGRADFAAEDGANLGEGLTFGGLAGVGYSFDNGLRLSGGLLFSTRLEEDPLVVPAIVVNWQINEQWSLSNDEGLGLQLRYEPNERWQFGVGASFARDEFRLDGSGFAPDGVGKRIRWPLRAEAVWTPDPRVSILANIGTDLEHEVQIADRDGVRRKRYTVDPSLSLGASVEIRF